MSCHVVQKVQSARAEDGCPSPDHTVESDPTLSAHCRVTWLKGEAFVSCPSSRVLGMVSWQGRNFKK